MPRTPLVYEVNTHAWLRDLSEQAGKPVTLKDVPDAELDKWASLGFTHIWLMGVWRIGVEPRARALEHWEKEWKKEIPSTAEDVIGSPYANWVPDVSPAVGGITEIVHFRRRILEKNLYLIFDFVGNHVASDHPWIAGNPSLFVQSNRPRPGAFPSKTKFGKRYFAHGRDPYFPPWDDTVQLDYRTRPVHYVMADLAAKLSIFCDGFRCDMAMLLLHDIFEKTWRDFPVQVKDPPQCEFWAEVMERTRIAQSGAPGFHFMAEAYWDTEERLLQLGFNSVYLKRVCEFITRRQIPELQEYLYSKHPAVLTRGVYFLENHDEPRIASLLKVEEHKAAALFLLSAGGTRLLHDGQLEGRKAFARIQMSKRAGESVDSEISNFYSALLAKLRTTLIGSGEYSLLKPQSAGAEDPSHTSVFAHKWTYGEAADLAIINLGNEPARCLIPRGELPETQAAELLYSVGEATAAASASEAVWTFELPPHSGQILRFGTIDPKVVAALAEAEM